MISKTLAVAAIVALATSLITAAAMSSDNAFAKYRKKETQSMAQANACGNGPLPLNIFCQNAGSQVQGKDNSVSVSASQL
jgi:hypothetical protein